MELTQEQLKELLHYDPETGIFRWRKAVSDKIKPWSIAGTRSASGYIKIAINKKLYRAHRLSWLYMTGEAPKDQIDHIDGVRHNNSWANLRQATSKQNNENRALGKHNTSGYKGVFWSKKSQKWLARVRHNYKAFYLGYFKTAEEANLAAIAKRAELFTHDTGRDQVTQNGSFVI